MNPTKEPYRRRPLAVAVAFVFAAGSSHAATIAVTDGGDNGDSGTCTLRQAIVSMESQILQGSCIDSGDGFGTNDAIDFDASTVPSNSTITLSMGQLVVSALTAPLTIEGGGRTIDANQNSRVLYVHASEVTLNSLTLSGGHLARYSGHAGGAYVNGGGTLALASSAVSGNYSGGPGGVLVDGATLIMTESNCSGNSSYFYAGGIGANESSVTLTRSTVENNFAVRYGGGGLFAHHGTLSITDSTITGNSSASSSYGGGGVWAYDASTMLTNSTISGNFTHTIGGAIYAVGGTLILVNSTVSANSSYLYGGGMAVVGLSTLTLANTILAENSAGMSSPDIYSALTAVDATYSLLGSDFNVTPYTDAGNHNVISDSPLLSGLGSYGGPTQTMKPLPGSLAIDKGDSGSAVDPATGFALAFDQRGIGFSRTLSGKVDIGAYQHQPTDRIFANRFEAGP